MLDIPSLLEPYKTWIQLILAGQDVGLGLAVAVPQEKVWRGGGWSKRQKLSFVRKAFDQLIQRLRALQAEWDEFEKTIDDEELGMIVRTLAHEIAGTLTLLLGCDGLEARGKEAWLVGIPLFFCVCRFGVVLRANQNETLVLLFR
ncbi:MAG: hypothetical protein R6U57_10560 [Anaerolineales bacterium]